MPDVPDEIESRYYEAQAFDSDHARTVRSHYLPFVAGRDLLVELGCGRGEFLSVVAEAGAVGRVLGVDIDPAMVAAVRAAGHEAVEADLLDYLRDTDDRPDAVFLAHVIEHLTVGDAFAMLARLAELMPPGGRLVVVTPNPACLANLTNDFWSDPTHVRLYSLDLLRFLLEQTGFDVVDAAGNPLDVPGPPPLLLAPVTELPAWGAAEVTLPLPRGITYDADAVGVADLLTEVAELRNALATVVHWLGTYDDRLADVRHLTEALARSHDTALAHHYGPNEIYVVGERRP